MHYKRLVLLALLGVTLPAFGAKMHAQNSARDHAAEVKAEVPELKAFHTVIYEIWHGAWPKKDTGQLAALLPKVQAGVKSVADAELPGILRDRKTAWEENVKALQVVAADYDSAVEKKDQQKLLDAAEKLHAQYERLVRVIRPALKELEEFHAVLYMLYHYYMPGDSLEQMKSSAAALKEKMVVLDKAMLPERLKSKEPVFTTARQKLATSVDALATTATSDDLKKIKAAAVTVHTDYQVLEKVFE
ncbi:hypothetical protein EHM92_01220 [bacterium]|nr:MAG: hypothetical protein EHM92_01220 [bacterium]